MLTKSNSLIDMISVSKNKKKLFLAFDSSARVLVLTLFRMDLFGLLTNGGRGKGPLPKIRHRYPAVMNMVYLYLI